MENFYILLTLNKLIIIIIIIIIIITIVIIATIIITSTYIFKIFTSHSLVSGSKPFAASKGTQPFNLSSFSMHLADFLIILYFYIQVFVFIFNKCWLDAFYIFKVFFKIFRAFNKIIDSKLSKGLKFLTFE